MTKQETRPRLVKKAGRIIVCMLTTTRVVVFTCVAAVAVFCIVQDRLTASGADRYVRLQRAASAGTGTAVTIDQVMIPAVHDAVRRGLMWSAAVAACGLATAVVVARRGRRE